MGTNIPDSLLSSPPVSCSGLLFVELNRKPEGRGTQVTKPQSTAYSSKKEESYNVWERGQWSIFSTRGMKKNQKPVWLQLR